MPGVDIPSSPRRRFVSSPARVLAPWWVLALGVVYGAYFVLLTPFEVRGERLRWRPDPASGAVIVQDDRPRPPAGSPGLMSGDRVLDVGGRRVADLLDWVVAVAHFPSDQPVEVKAEREGRAISASVGPPPRAPTESLDVRKLFFYASFRLPALTMALLLVWRRPRDPQALVGAWLMATLATVTDTLPEGMAATWRALPGPVAGVLWIPLVSGLAFATAIGLTFSATFPKPLVRRAWVWALLWTPSFALLAWLAPVLARAAADGRTGPGDLQHVLRLAPAVNVLYLVGSLAALALGYRRLTDPNEKRRVRVLVAAAVVAVVVPLPVQVMQAVAPSTRPVVYTLALAASLLQVLFPLAFAYAVLRHRAFDLRLVVRASVRYALARRTLLALVPLLAGVLVCDLLLHGSEPFLAVVSRRGWIYAGLVAIALAARARQARWLDALDRRFFRERYDALRLLRDVVQDVEQDASPAAAALRAVVAIEKALHAELVALLLEEPAEGTVRAIAVAPAGRQVPPWPADSRVLGVLQALGAPLPVTQATGVVEGLPAEEVDRLEQTGVDLVVPVPVPGRQAALVLGPKRSAEPWDREERDLLMAVASALGTLLRREPSAATPTMTAPSDAPERYRLERPLGSGGMGVVYEGFDRDLERRVAIKLLREDRAPRAEDRRRFRREARALAAFSHPNVVTIHDFGVDREGRAFLVMEFLVGPTLRGLLRSEGALTVARTLAILGGIASAVEAAHRLTLVHRDLKPENVILAQGETGEVAKVLDFGLARLLPAADATEGETATHGVAGTPRYMAPEQLTGGTVDPSWDVWALSVMAYEMLTGTHPFVDPGCPGLRSALLAGHVRPVRLPLSEGHPALDAFFARALAVGKESRPPSPSGVLAELQAALAGAGRRG